MRPLHAPDARYSADVAVVGGGIAGISAALQLLDEGLSVVLFDRDEAESLGGLACRSFGGIFLVDSKEQRRQGFKDSPDLALADWIGAGEIASDDGLARAWAAAFVEGVSEDVDAWLRSLGVRFFPIVHWVERGLDAPGNSVPRFHMVWGTGRRLMDILIGRLRDHPHRRRLQLCFEHRVTDLDVADGSVCGVIGTAETDGQAFRADVQSTVIASGGYCGNEEWLRDHWDAELGRAPETILNGSHRYATGELHRVVQEKGGTLSNIDRAWFYAAGVRHPRPRHRQHGLSVVPPRSALWLDQRGRRIGPDPLITGFDTRALVQRICHLDGGYSWQVMNRRIAEKELAISGAEFNDAIRRRSVVRFLKTIVLGNTRLVRELVAECEDFVVARSVAELVEKMNGLTGGDDVDPAVLEETIARYDAAILDGSAEGHDAQVRRIAELRRYRGDRVRLSRSQLIRDPRSMPLVGIREFIISRKSLGGLRTDLSCRVLSPAGKPAVRGLYAVGETAGFGGGGIHGKRSLEGTFLATCIFTGRRAGRVIAGKDR